jgi:hypothetical protein
MKPQENEVLDNDIKAIMEDLLNRAIYAKTEMCKDDPMQDSPPLFLVAVESDDSNPDHEACVDYQHEFSLSKPYHLAMIPLIHQEDIYDAYEDVVKALPIRPFDFLVLLVEGYAKSEMTEEEVMNHDRGDFEKDYKENPFSDVREGIMMTAVDWNATSVWSIASLYRYDDQGVPEFDEEPMCTTCTVDTESETNGRIPDTLLATVGYMQLATKTLAYKEMLDKAPKRKKGE